MPKIIFVEGLDNYTLSVRCDDGVSGTVSLASSLFGPVFEPLRDPEFFRQVAIDEYGAVYWPNGADLAPDALYEQIQAASHLK